MEHGIRIRTAILIWLLMSGASFSYSQEYIPFPTSDAYWNDIEFFQGWCDPPDYCKHTYFIDGDTLIESLTYTKVNSSNGGAFYEYVGGIREQDKRVYFKAAYCPNSIILYDFNFSVGDSMRIPIELCDTSLAYYMRVLSVDSVLLEDMSYRRRISFDAGWSWIEGIGSPDGLLYPYFFDITCICWVDMVCFYHNDKLLYIDETYVPCFNFIVSNGELENNQSLISTFPNPFTAYTTIEYELIEPSHVQLTIYNAIGEQVYKAEDCFLPMGKHSFSWTADRLPEGMYYGVLRSDEGVSVVKMVKQ